MYHVTTEVERRGMPLEIALLPMIESAFNPVAYSSAHASGIWQFIPSTGKTYGLKQNWWYDGRRDVIAATQAALDYLQTLHRMFNDWELALAAYNWGEGAVQRAIDRNIARGLPTDYQSLYPGMPAETRNYVPKLLAVKNIIDNPARFGIALAHVPNEPYFETVTIRRHIDITLAARFAGMTMEEFRFLNPAHNKPVINSDSAETIVLPRHRVALFNTHMAQYANRPLVSTKTHLVRAGERPESIAELYGISVAELNNMNNIGGRRRIVTGQSLVVPNRDDLQPVLADLPVATTVFAAAARPVYTRQNVARTMVVNRNGQRRAITVAAPVQRVANRMPIRRAAVAAKPAQRKVVYNAPPPVVTIRNR
jgi:membrane-bound lytic murein transglycosylase D